MKPTLLSLRQNTPITTQDVAQKAGVSLTQAYVVEIGGFADKAIAKKVIAAFSSLSGKDYTLDDIRLQNVSTLRFFEPSFLSWKHRPLQLYKERDKPM